MMNVPFTPGGTIALAATGTSGRVALPAVTALGQSPQVLIYNAGTTDAFIAFGDVTVAAIIATDGTVRAGTPIPAGIYTILTFPSNATHVAGIMASSTATLYFTFGCGE